MNIEQDNNPESNAEEIESAKSRFDFVRLHIGSNSIFLTGFLSICLAVAYKNDFLNWNYLRGIDENLSFFVGLFSIVFGIGFYSFWKLGQRSSYAVHLTKKADLPRDANIIYDNDNLSFAVSYKSKIKPRELPSAVRALFCIGVVFNMSLITLDNVGFTQIKNFPEEIMTSKSEFCPEEEDLSTNAPPALGCELIIRAYKLGYAKDLGACEPKKIAVENLQICKKRRLDEPYLHYMSRLLVDSYNKKLEFFKEHKIKQIEDKFDLQLKKLKSLRDYETYAISAAPRASHHIWTNLSYPANIFVEKYREYLSPNYCIEKFQNQTNSINVTDSDERKTSKLLEHVYGHLLFNPKSDITVAYCKEYQIHWNSDPQICDKLIANPRVVLHEQGILEQVQLVLNRHDIVNDILSLEESIHRLEEEKQQSDKTVADAGSPNLNAPNKKHKQVIVKSKIAKDKRQIRQKTEIVSFQCFMQQESAPDRTSNRTLNFDGVKYPVETRYFSQAENKGEAQIAMYNEFSTLLDNRFHYSKLSSRSDINVELERKDSADEANFLDNQSYLLARLEVLKNVDIFLGNSWVLERDDLLKLYPYHVHLQNYVTNFRQVYADDHGRL